MVWAIAKTMVRSLFLAGHDTVILDATNLTKRRRNEWLDAAWRVEMQVFKTSVGECLERAYVDKRYDLVPVIKRMAEGIEWPETSGS